MTRYCVFRYSPNPIAGELINFGVAAFDGEAVKFRFTKNWRRIDSFGNGEDISLLTEFEDRCKSDPVGTFDKPAGVSWAEVFRLVSLHWINSIQVSAPSGSLDPIDKCLDSMSEVFL